MGQNRQDAWTEEEDVLLAETVLRYIREGKTQLEAFEDVARQLSRTKAACGFRWNATVRKQHEEAIQQAKEERRKKDRNNKPETEHDRHPENAIDEAIHLLTRMKQSPYQIACSEEDGHIQKLVKENEELKNQLHHYETFIQSMENMLLQIRQTKKQG
ncbi:RsfA family transcription factor [Melghiribacillus thermohalophilus]|uniref:RsfA family transcription factor n=1 Tax=Melghiribacillus thermohalophilus TaxID=1324956 RepID=A0A4R3ND22_9BACI|nr:RsfA family transcriptional regulator [Melghiribacillus thermohalophilus]TCT26883.1 RsfA family transcription factor [Melghiribacillus thermohalophilus]